MSSNAGLIALIVYAILGMGFLGNWKNMEGGGKFLTFVVFPMHVVVFLLLSPFIGGVKAIGGNSDMQTTMGFLFKVVVWVAFVGFWIWLIASIDNR